MSTKELILRAATTLFNRHGTAQISTNHIAKEAGISPGNLYYHYKDKAHIIREIYELMIKEWETSYDRVESRRTSIQALKQFIDDNFEMLWRYRFFNRETVALLNADPSLAARHIEITAERFERQRELFQQAVEDKTLRFPVPEVQPDEVLTMIWIIANHYLIHLESMGRDVEQRDFHAGAELISKVLYPYLNS